MPLRRKQSVINAADDASEFDINLTNLTNIRASITRFIMTLAQNSVTFTSKHLICI